MKWTTSGSKPLYMPEFGGKGLQSRLEERCNALSEQTGAGLQFSDGQIHLVGMEVAWDTLKTLLENTPSFVSRIAGERLVQSEIDSFLVRYEREHRVNLLEVRYKLNLPEPQ